MGVCIHCGKMFKKETRYQEMCKKCQKTSKNSAYENRLNSQGPAYFIWLMRIKEIMSSGKKDKLHKLGIFVKSRKRAIWKYMQNHPKNEKAKEFHKTMIKLEKNISDKLKNSSV